MLISHRLELFIAGESSCFPSCYFELVSLRDKLADGKDNALLDGLEKIITLNCSSDELRHEKLSLAASIAEKFQVKVLPIPTTSEAYTTWYNDYVAHMEEKFPMNHISHYYFYYARRVMEFVNKLQMSGHYLELMKLDGKLGLGQDFRKNLHDAEYILFKLIAPAALLSSEHGHRFFNVFYQDINKGFDQFRKLDFNESNFENMEPLKSTLQDYGYRVNNGLQQCVETLTELTR